MSVPKGKRSESSVEFDNTYYKIYYDFINLMNNKYGVSETTYNLYSDYIRAMNREIVNVIMELGTNIRIANSIFPVCKSEYETRRIAQDKAIGLCFDLLTKYQLLMKTLNIKDDKFVNEIINIRHEINCLKSWRTSDYSRYKTLG